MHSRRARPPPVGANGDDKKADWVLATLGKHGIDGPSAATKPP